MTVQIQRGLEIVPGYTLVRRVGSGMAGEVWVARASGGVHVAIKIIRDMAMVGSKRELGALRIVREVKHTNLCPLIGVWFFDREGELLSNSATDEILGRESSLIDTELLATQNTPGDDLRETRSIELIGKDDSGADANEGAAANEDAEVDSGSGALALPHEARQMVVAMGLGERTLHDRLVEMRAPDNMPQDGDPDHLPGGIPVKELLRYIEGAASAIDELNLNHDIYHCDIKPQNILIVGGNAQVCDFGLARRVQESRRTQLAIGTPAYGAPEMLFDQTYTKSIDQYSLAITYYELRTGKLPFETSRRSTFLRAKANGELRLTDLPPAEQVVMERATQLDSEDRYPSCMAFVEELARAVQTRGSADSVGSAAVGVGRRLTGAGLLVGVISVAALSSRCYLERPVTQGTDPDTGGDFVDVKDVQADELVAADLVGSAPELSGTDVSMLDAVAQTDALTTSVDPVESILEPDSGSLDSDWVEVAIVGDAEPESKVSVDLGSEPIVPEEAYVQLMEPASAVSLDGPPVVEALDAEMVVPESGEPESVALESVAPGPVVPTWDDLIAEATKQAEQVVELQKVLDRLPTGTEEADRKSGELNQLIVALGKKRERPEETSPDAGLPKESRNEASPSQGSGKVAGFDLLSSEMRHPSITIAGLVNWNNQQTNQAIRHWISLQNESGLSANVPEAWRNRVADHLLDWLIEGSGVADEDVQALRYVNQVKRATGVLSLCDRFAFDSIERARQIQRERFLLSAAQADAAAGLKIWERLLSDRGVVVSDDVTPQMGLALSRLSNARLKQSLTTSQRIETVGQRVLASVRMCVVAKPTSEIMEGDFDPVVDQEATLDELLNVVDVPADGLPVVPTTLQTGELVEFCSSYVDRITALPAAEGHSAFLQRLSRVEICGAIAAMLLADPALTTRMRLIASEAFMQARYEQADEIPEAKLIGRLQAYATPLDAATTSSEGLFVLARVEDQIGALMRDKQMMLAACERARKLYSQVIDDGATPNDLRGSAARGRAHLLTRLAAIAEPSVRSELLEQAVDDASLSLELPQRWHQDTDDRLTTAAEVNLSMVRLVKPLEVEAKQDLLDDADQYLAQAIAERDKRDYSSKPHATLRLNGYLLDLLPPIDGTRRDAIQAKALAWMEQNSVTSIAKPTTSVVRTIDSKSTRLQCHWHCMCAMVLDVIKRPGPAMQHIEHAYHIARERLDSTDDRRHFATLILVQLKSPALFQNVGKDNRPDAKLVAELSELLHSIEDPLPAFQDKKSGYLRELQAMSQTK
ncbi:Protein kinase domain-containing protein [Neorhodopirellula lusitana]|uniref:Protein kinase domain-containing protein n=1 Tax=Neorhodopirellula lusitana TaxID=445327 RepID=A0ABY1PQ81_9BACT|nr:protein kinase [Neorhodopirellula lusitana]SMP37780.1 Protein kinase domain-containing protein [Neorhodopirellula lusitana]